MAYDEKLAERVRGGLEGKDGITERKMFGGLCFLLNGNMVCGITNNDLMLRMGPELSEQALEMPDTRPMDFTGRKMKGMVYVNPEGTATDDDLVKWLAMASSFAETLPPK